VLLSVGGSHPANLKDVDWSYIAGFVDADGSIGIERRKRASGEVGYSVKLYITNADRETMDWLVTNLNGSVYLTNRNSPKHHQTMWRWVVRGKKAGPIIQKLLPYLHLKKKRAEIAMRFIETITDGKRLDDKSKHLREYLANQLSRMNFRGRPR